MIANFGRLTFSLHFFLNTLQRIVRKPSMITLLIIYTWVVSQIHCKYLTICYTFSLRLQTQTTRQYNCIIKNRLKLCDNERKREFACLRYCLTVCSLVLNSFPFRCIFQMVWLGSSNLRWLAQARHSRKNIQKILFLFFSSLSSLFNFCCFVTKCDVQIK